MFSRTNKKIGVKRPPKETLDVYEFCKKQWGLTRDQITKVEKKKTYKNFVEYTVHWKSETGEGKHVFKMIVKGENLL
jgi:hypothetical protein